MNAFSQASPAPPYPTPLSLTAPSLATPSPNSLSPNSLSLVPLSVNPPPVEPLLIALFITIAALTFLMSNPSTSDVNTQSLRIGIPPYLESPPTTPSPPPRKTTPPPAPARRIKVISLVDDELDAMIVRFLDFNPGCTVKDILKILKSKDPSLTKSDINSRLYHLLMRNVLNKEGDVGAPNWFVN